MEQLRSSNKETALMRIVHAFLLSLMLVMVVGRSAMAIAPQSCEADFQRPGTCSPFDANQPCHRSGDAPGVNSGVCAALSGCTCVDPSPQGAFKCSMTPFGAPAASTAATVFIALLGMGAWMGRRLSLRRRG
jgi:hypothetical protein